MTAEEFKTKHSISSDIEKDLFQVYLENKSAWDKEVDQFKEEYGFFPFPIDSKYSDLYVVSRIMDNHRNKLIVKNLMGEVTGSVVTKKSIDILTEMKWKFDIVKPITLYELVKLFSDNDVTANAKRKAISHIDNFVKHYKSNWHLNKLK